MLKCGLGREIVVLIRIIGKVVKFLCVWTATDIGVSRSHDRPHRPKRRRKERRRRDVPHVFDLTKHRFNRRGEPGLFGRALKKRRLIELRSVNLKKIANGSWKLP